MGVLQYFGWADGLSPWVHASHVLGEAQANLRQRNQLATLTAMGIVAVLWWARHGLSHPHALWMLALIAIARELNPDIQIVVRTHSEEEAGLLEREIEGKVFLGEEELAQSMTRYVLEHSQTAAAARAAA